MLVMFKNKLAVVYFPNFKQHISDNLELGREFWIQDVLGLPGDRTSTELLKDSMQTYKMITLNVYIFLWISSIIYVLQCFICKKEITLPVS